MVAGFRRQSTETLARVGAVAGVCAVAGWMVTQLWTQQNSLATLQNHTSGEGVSGLELLRAQALDHPRDWRWSLLLARAQHDEGDRESALRTLRPLHRLHPDRPEVMALWALLALETNQVAELIKSLNERVNALPAERRLSLGLLLADLQRMSGDAQAAADRYVSLIKDSPQQPEPLLALALLKRDQGQGAEAIDLLRKAMTLDKRLLSPAIDLQTLELRWALEAARNSPIRSGLRAVTTP